MFSVDEYFERFRINLDIRQETVSDHIQFCQMPTVFDRNELVLRVRKRIAQPVLDRGLGYKDLAGSVDIVAVSGVLKSEPNRLRPLCRSVYLAGR